MDEEVGRPGPSWKLVCPACRATLAPWRLQQLDIWMYRCPSCAGWLCPRGTPATLSRLELQIQRRDAFDSFSPEEREEMAREIAAEAAASAPDRELPPVQDFLARFGIPVVTSIHRERIPAMTWALALTLVAVFVVETRGADVEQMVARFGYGPDNRGLWAALKAALAHGGIGHLVGNAYLLLVFGDGVEQRVPRWLYLPAFVAAAVGVLLVDAALHPQSVLIGASGGVAALIGACVVLQPRAQVAVRLLLFELRLRMPTVFLLALAFQGLMAALHVPGVAWTAHLLGLATGAIGAALLLIARRSRRS
ncbi:MAG TPA: rhomboid family intramembrane serine protease [Polyangia bacterium]|nr:rhomboid family intramembrane serine protease [Polyangia bacterium]